MIRHHVYLQKKQPNQRGGFFCLSRKNLMVAVLAIPETLPKGEKMGLPEENVAQVSSKHNEYQVSFIYKVRVPGKVLLLSNFLIFVETCLIV